MSTNVQVYEEAPADKKKDGARRNLKCATVYDIHPSPQNPVPCKNTVHIKLSFNAVQTIRRLITDR